MHRRLDEMPRSHSKLALGWEYCSFLAGNAQNWTSITRKQSTAYIWDDARKYFMKISLTWSKGEESHGMFRTQRFDKIGFGWLVAAAIMQITRG